MYRLCMCLFIFVNLLFLGNADVNKIPEYRLCADPSCTAPISEAHGSVSYSKENNFMLSFKRGDKMTIIGKADEKNHYWTAKIGNRIGFVPQDLIKEDRVYFSNDKLSHKVPTAKENESDVNSSAPEISSSLPDINNLQSSLNSSFSNLNNGSEQTGETSAPYEVFDGTTIYNVFNESEEVKPSSTFQADSSTKIPEPIGNEVPEPVMGGTPDKNAEENDDEEDDDYDDNEDEDEEGNDSADEEENESKNEEGAVTAKVNKADEPIENYVENKNAKVLTSEVSKDATQNDESVNIAAEAFSSDTNSNAEQNDDSWGNVFDTLAKIVTSSEENEADTENAAKPEAESKPEVLENISVSGNSVKENSTADIKADFQSEAAVTEATVTNNESTEKDSVIAPNVIEQNIDNVVPSEPVNVFPYESVNLVPNEPVNAVSNEAASQPSNEPVNLLTDNVQESHQDPENLTSFNIEVENMTKVVQILNDAEKISTQEETESELPSVPEEINQVPQSFNLEQNIATPENNLQEDAIPVIPPIPPLLRTFESTTEKFGAEYPHSETPLKTEETGSHFLPMTQAAEVKEVTTESYKKMEEIVTEEAIAQDMKPESHFEGTAEPIQQPILNENNNEVVEEKSDFFSGLLDTIYGFIGLKQKDGSDATSGIAGDVLQTDLNEKQEFEKVGEHLQEAIPEGNCKTVVGLESNCEDAPLAVEASHYIWDSWYSPSRNMDANATFYTTLSYLVITAVTVLLFTLGYYFVEGNRKCSPLIAKVNHLEKQLMVATTECAGLKDELQATKHKLVLYEDSSNNELVISLQSELKEAQRRKSELEATIESLQQELDTATEAGLDLNRMLTEVLTQKGGSDSLMESVERLQAQLDSQQKIIDDMNTSLVMKNQENEGLQVELASASEKIENLEEELNDIKQNLHILLKEKEYVTGELTTRSHQFQIQIKQITESKDKEILALKQYGEDLAKQLKELSDALTLKEGELNALKESVSSIKSNKKFNVQELFDVTQVKAELTKAEKEKSGLQTKLQGEEDARKSLEDRLNLTVAEVQKLKQSCEEAEKEKAEAQTKLEVLSKYFKEKEMQLQKELGLQEAMWLQKQGDDSSIYERMTSLQGEIDDYRSQNETLKKEILDQERGLKSQIATLEKKAHENWVAARQAERKLEETKQEAAQLRNRLTMIEKNINNELEAKPNHRLTEEMNGGETFSPLLHDTSSPMPFPPLPLDPNSPSLLPPGFMPPPMFIPPPPPLFIPPPPPGGPPFLPPPPFLPGDRRPPPLGRMSSPPLNNRFSPPSPDYMPDRSSPPPLSPPVRNYRSPNDSERDREQFRHRTPPFSGYSPRDWQDSHSGGAGFRPISSHRDSRKDHKGSTLSSGHSSSDSLDKSSRHSGRV